MKGTRIRQTPQQSAHRRRVRALTAFSIVVAILLGMSLMHAIRVQILDRPPLVPIEDQEAIVQLADCSGVALRVMQGEEGREIWVDFWATGGFADSIGPHATIHEAVEAFFEGGGETAAGCGHGWPTSAEVVGGYPFEVADITCWTTVDG